MKTATLLIVFLFCGIAEISGITVSGNQPPNVLFIIVDDLRPELGCYGKKQIISPNIDRLAKTGQLFTRAYVNYPVCGPSRASMLSGLYPGRTRFNGWNCSQDLDAPGIISLPMHFRNNHYRTISMGKVYNNFEDGKGSWDEIWRPAATTTSSWDYQDKESIGIFNRQNKDRQHNLSARNNRNLPRRGPAFERPDVGDIAYEDGRIAGKTIEKLQELKTSGHPFFLAVGFKKPHLPFNAPDRYWAMYDKRELRLPENRFQPRAAPGESMHHFGELRSFCNIPKDGPLPDSLVLDLIHGYYACVSYVDAQIGKVLDALEDLALEENTIVVLVGDHGWNLGEHNLWCKDANFQTALKVPLLIKAPGIRNGVVNSALVETVDIYPTICELAGLSRPVYLQGRHFLSVTGAAMPEDKSFAFCRTGLNGETIISATHSYTEFFDDKGKVKATMLYDLQKDPDENTNIAGIPGNAGICNDLSKILTAHLRERDRISLIRKP